MKNVWVEEQEEKLEFVENGVGLEVQEKKRMQEELAMVDGTTTGPGEMA